MNPIVFSASAGHIIRIVVEPMLEWEIWRTERNGAHVMIVGREQWPRFQYWFQVKPTLLETDPGPLDARVP